MRFVSLLITLCLLVSCDRKEQIPPPAGLKSPDLPTALHSRPLEESEWRYIEIVISADKTEIFHQGKRVTTTTTPDQLSNTLKKLRVDNDMMGYSSPLIISAPGSTPFTTIEERIRSALEIGIYRILYLLSTDQTSDPMIVSTELVWPAISKIDPYFLHITSEGHVYSGTGEARTQMDNGVEDQQLNKLSDQLQLFSSATKAAGISYIPCQIYIEPNATYQRVIDVISLINKYQINPFFTDMIEEPEPEPEQYRGPDFVPYPPSPPSSGVRPLGLAPKE